MSYDIDIFDHIVDLRQQFDDNISFFKTLRQSTDWQLSKLRENYKNIAEVPALYGTPFYMSRLIALKFIKRLEEIIFQCAQASNDQEEICYEWIKFLHTQDQAQNCEQHID